MGIVGYFMGAIRQFLAVFDAVAVTLLNGIFKVFYMVANATIISGDVIKVFYSRIQLILGILMIFKLSMTVLNIIINPDSINDQKQGTGKIVMRVVISLFLLTLIIPMNIPGASSEKEQKSLNYYINDYGVLFGILQKVQVQVLDENIIAKLVLGTPTDTSDTGMDVNSLSDIGNSMASSVLKVFLRINLKDDSEPACKADADENDSDPCPNVVCPEVVNTSGYAEENVDPLYLLDYVSETCKPSGGGDEEFAFDYTPIAGAAVMIIMTLIVLGFTLDVAVRSIKLMILRLIAPIPIISYIDPKQEQKGSFGNWVKALISTYADLFVRLAIIYFGLFAIQSIINGGMDIFSDTMDASFMVKGFAMIFLILGVLVFMRQAPKFIRDLLGIQGNPMGNVGLASVMGGAAALLGGAGLAGAGSAMVKNFQDANEAAAQGKSIGLGWRAGRDLAAQIRTGNDKERGGVVARIDRELTRRAKNRAAARVGASADNLQFRKDKMIHDTTAYGQAETDYDKYKNHNYTYNAAGQLLDARGNVIQNGTHIYSRGEEADAIQYLAQRRDRLKATMEDSQRQYEKIEKANKGLDYQENEYEKWHDVRRHNRHKARRNQIRRASGGPMTYREAAETRATNRFDSGRGETL